jgi:hypothetical protein
MYGQQDRLGTDSWSGTAADQLNSSFATYTTQSFRPPQPFIMMDYPGMRVTQGGGDSMRDIDNGTTLQRGTFSTRKGQDGGRDTDSHRMFATVPCMSRGHVDPTLERDISMGQYTGSRRPSVMQQSETVMHSRSDMPMLDPVAQHVRGRGQNQADVYAGWDRGGTSSRDQNRDT